MQLKPSDSVLAKRTLLNYLIAFESILLFLLTSIAVKVRHIGEDISYKNDAKEFVLLIAFPLIWLCCLSLFGAWDMTILDNHIDGYRRLLRSSFMTFLAFSSASYLFKIQISRFVILFSLVGGTILHLILRWVFLRIVDMKLKNSASIDNWLVLIREPKLISSVQALATFHSAEFTHSGLFDNSENFRKWVDEVVFQVTLSKYNRVLLADVHALDPVQIEQLMWAVQQTGADFLVYDHLGLATSQSQLKYYDGFNWISIGTAQISDSSSSQANIRSCISRTRNHSLVAFLSSDCTSY